ncbi:RNA helicase [Sarracenia purpurea var. burkii]
MAAKPPYTINPSASSNPFAIGDVGTNSFKLFIVRGIPLIAGISAASQPCVVAALHKIPGLELSYIVAYHGSPANYINRRLLYCTITKLKALLARPPDISVATPACMRTCISRGVLHLTSVQDSLSILVLDKADLLLSYGYEDDLKALTTHIPRRCQCLLMSATSRKQIHQPTKQIHDNKVSSICLAKEGF